MSLSADEIAELRPVLADIPLVQQSPRFVDDLALYLARLEVETSRVLFDPTTAVGTLYLLGQGAITQTMGSSGQQWYQKELRPGEFLGQRSLVIGKHEARAVTTAPSVVYSMYSVDLSSLLDRYPAFRDVLWKETLASRLRSLPIFESLADGEINWLAELVEQVTLPQGAEVPLDEKPGLWLVDWGQIRLAGPAANLPSLPAPAQTAGPVQAGSPAPSGYNVSNPQTPSPSEPEWVVTAGNFFFSLQPGPRFGGRCAAVWARTVRETRLFFLPERHFNRLLAALPGVKPMTDAPVDIPACLASVPLFTGRNMSESHIQNLAQICAWAFVPANQNISSQGTVGYSFVYLMNGGGLVSAVDDKGHRAPVHLLQPGEYYGKTSLLDSTRRNATVRAVPGPAGGRPNPLGGAEILNLDRRDLEVAFAEHTDLWRPGVELYDRYARVREERPRYDWLDEGEQVVWTDRKHWYALVRQLVIEALLLVGGLIALDFLLFQGLGFTPGSLAITDVVVLALVGLPIVGYTAWNYWQAYYVVTNRRVTRRDIQFFYSENRLDAPLESVQDVTSNSNLGGRIFGFGDVTIRTAAKVGSVLFYRVPQPEIVQNKIVQARTAAAVAARGSTKEALRRGLLSDLRLALTVPDLDALRALGENARPRISYTAWQRFTRALSPANRRRARALPPRRRNMPGWLRSVLAFLLPSGARDLLLGPPPRERPLAGGEVVWRKHWVNLLQRSGGAWLTGALLLFAGVFIFTSRDILGNDFTTVLLPWLLLLAIVAFWIWYAYVDWSNDLYIVTDEKIIDVEKKPLALSRTQRESSLEVIQTVNSKQPSIWAKIFNYGEVQIRTAAADEGFTFVMVPSPMFVQRTIFQRMDAYRRRQEQKRLEDRRRDVMEGLSVYHDLQGDQQGRLF